MEQTKIDELEKVELSVELRPPDDIINKLDVFHCVKGPVCTFQ